jgi:hypothetical protein
MNEDLNQAAERLHHYQASFLEDVAVVEKFGDETVWSGVVSVFEIKGHCEAVPGILVAGDGDPGRLSRLVPMGPDAGRRRAAGRPG